MSKRTGIFAEKPGDRLTRLLKEEEFNLARAERALFDGSMTFSLQQVRQGKEDILAIRARIASIKKKLANAIA